MVEVLLILLFVILNYLDIATTLRALERDLKEINPIVFKVYEKFGMKGMLLFKAIGVAGFIGTAMIYPINITIIIVLVYALIVANNVGALCHVGD